MAQYILKRIVFMIPTVFIISVLTFIIIQLPPGDFVSTMVTNSAAQGQNIDAAEWEREREQKRAASPAVAISGVFRKVSDPAFAAITGLVKQALVLGEPDRFFTTPEYREWPLVLLRLDTVDAERLAELVTDAWQMRREVSADRTS